jgi:hypothetical protein
MLAAVLLLWLFSNAAAAAEARFEITRDNGGRAVLVFAGAPLKAMTEIPFTIAIYDARGNPLREAKLKLSLTMPFMPMPPNHPEASWSEGAYRGTAVFTMAGAWQVHVDIEQPGAATENLVFDLEMVIMQ